MNIQDKYSQAEVVAFWTHFAESGLQAAESQMIEQYAPPPTARVLDIGCGAGRVTLALAPQGYEVVGLDITAAMVQAARKLATSKNVCGEFVQGDLRDLSFARESFAVALIFIAALQHVAERTQRQAALRQIARVLKKDGVLILALDNVAPALMYYVSWGVEKIRRISTSPPAPLLQGEGSKLSRPAGEGRSSRVRRDWGKGERSADAVLASNRSRMSAIAWHARGLGRTLRWRTWEGVRDVGRTMRIISSERGDTFIHQVSMPPTAGKVYYHLYRHEELIEDAKIAGLQLLGYHSGHELAEGKTFGETARRLDKQVMYAFTKVG